MKFATPLTNGIDALIGFPLTVNPTDPWVFDGKTVAVSVTGVPTDMLGGAVSVIGFPLGVATIASWADVDALACAPAAGMYVAMK